MKPSFIHSRAVRLIRNRKLPFLLLGTLIVAGASLFVLQSSKFGKPITSIECYPAAAETLMWSSDSSSIACEGESGVINIFDAKTGQQSLQISGIQSRLSSIVWEQNRDRLAAIDEYSGKVYLWSTKSIGPPRTLPIDSISSNPSATRKRVLLWIRNLLASIPQKHGQIYIWDVDQHKLVASFDMGTAVSWSPDSSRLAIGNENGTIQIWDVLSSRMSINLQLHSKNMLSLAWSPDGKQIASFSNDGSSLIWNVGTGKKMADLIHSENVSDYDLRDSFTLAWSPDGETISGASRKRLYMWDGKAGTVLNEFEADAVTDLNPQSQIWSPNSKTLAVGASEQRGPDDLQGKVFMLYTNARKSPNVLNCVSHAPFIAWSPNGRMILSNCTAKTEIWQSESLIPNQ